MSQVRANKIQVPTNSDAWTNLTTDLATMADSANVVIRVASQAERDALTKVAGLTVVRTDLPGDPIQTCDGTNWSTQQVPKVWANGNVHAGSASSLLSNLQSGAVVPIIQAGSVTITPDANGYSNFNFPQPFPNGLIAAVATNGDNNATGKQYMVNLGSAASNATTLYFNINANGTPWTALCRIDYIAVGW